MIEEVVDTLKQAVEQDQSMFITPDQAAILLERLSYPIAITINSGVLEKVELVTQNIEHYIINNTPLVDDGRDVYLIDQEAL